MSIISVSNPRRASSLGIAISAGTYGLHPDARDWYNRVLTNGGTVSATTLAAVSTFCASISSAGIRDRFYRLNLFCGDSDASLNAVRTPLYRGPSLSGTQYGNTTDTNVNFVAGDYAENTGLKGNASTKYLNTGLNVNTLPDSKTRHLGFYMNELPTAGDQNGFMGALVTDAFYIEARTTPWVIARMETAQNSASSTSGTTYLKQLVIGENTPSDIRTDVRIYFGSTYFPTTRNNVTAGGTIARSIYVFAVNNNGSPANQSNARCSMYSVGLDLGGSIGRSAYVNAVNIFMTAMGRS